MSREESYISPEVAAKQSKLSVRRLMELAAQGTIRRKREKNNATGRTYSVFLAADIKKYLAGAPAISTAVALRNGGVPALPPAPQADSGIQPYEWLTLAEAEQYTRLPAPFLLRLIAAGKLAAFDVGRRAGGRWRVSKRRLDALSG